MHEYSNIEYFFNLDFFDAIEILRCMQERIQEDKLFERWIAYQSEFTFEEFKEKLNGKVIQKQEMIISSNKNTVDIMKDVNKIINAMGGNNGTV